MSAPGDLNVQPRGAAERCPYCHDHMAAAPQLVVECRGCGTEHHAVCLAELGRCTVLGCEQPEGQALPDDLDLAGMSDIARVIRKRARNRVRNFVRSHVKPVAVPDRVTRRRAFEGQVSLWLPEILEEALRNPALYDLQQMLVIKAEVKRRAARHLREVVGEWGDPYLRLELRSGRYSAPEKEIIREELRRRGLK